MKYNEKDKLYYDIVEDTEIYKKINPLAEEAAKLKLEKMGYTRETPNYILAFWNAKKDILKEFYDIDWKTPEELNKDIFFC